MIGQKGLGELGGVHSNVCQYSLWNYKSTTDNHRWLW